MNKKIEIKINSTDSLSEIIDKINKTNGFFPGIKERLTKEIADCFNRKHRISKITLTVGLDSLVKKYSIIKNKSNYDGFLL